MSEQKPDFGFRTYDEARTGKGQLISFASAVDKAEDVKTFFAENIYSIDRPETKVVGHGGYGSATRFNITQHHYAGSSNGYVEVLEIHDPPDGRWGIVVNEECGGHGMFTEWDSLAAAEAAWKMSWQGYRESWSILPTCPGFRRRVTYHELVPWFYAIGDQALIKDFAFPEHVQDDPVFRFGQRFVVTDERGLETVRTCLGTRFIDDEVTDNYSCETRKVRFRLVYWDDGTIWDESRHYDHWTKTGGLSVRPLRENERWVDEAVQEFRMMLTGKNDKFSVDLLDGRQFVGRFSPGKNDPSAAGDYRVTVKVKDKATVQGWVMDFSPTVEIPNVVVRITKKLEAKGDVVEQVRIDRYVRKKGGKKWSGVLETPKDQLASQ